VSVGATFTVRCDRIIGGGGITCGALFTAHTATAAAARREAAEAGWTRSGQADACAMHSRPARLTGPAAGSAGGTEHRG
jgi:hypothetical protein